MPLVPITEDRLRFFFYVARYSTNKLPILTGWSVRDIRSGLKQWGLCRNGPDDDEWRASAAFEISRTIDEPMTSYSVDYLIRLARNGQDSLCHDAEESAIPWPVIDVAGSSKQRAAELIAYAAVLKADVKPWFHGYTRLR